MVSVAICIILFWTLSLPAHPIQLLGHERNELAADFSQFGQGETFREISRIPIFNGFYIEFGCADGLLFSNSYFFEETYNWTGLCIEAHPLNVANARRNRPRATVVSRLYVYFPS